MEFFETLNKSELINLLGAGGNWIAGLGTLTAVYFTIRLARFPHKAKLKVEAGYALFAEGASIDEGFHITIANLGLHTVTISNIKLFNGSRKKNNWVFMPLCDDTRQIRSGSDAQIRIKYHENRQWKSALIKRLKLVDDELLETLHLRIESTTGYIKKVQLNKEFIDDLRHEIEMMEIDRNKTDREDS